MRLKQHISEENDLFRDRNLLDQDDLDDLRKGCMPFLKDVKKVLNHYWHYLWRGVMRPEGDFVYKKPRDNRRPTDSNIEWHKALDQALYNKFKVKPRSSGVFCKMVKPTGYGAEDYMVFPIGKYSCIWSDQVSDAYLYEPNRPGWNDWKEVMSDAEELMSSYHQTSIDKVVKAFHASIQKHEVTLMCRAYYLVDMKFRDQLDEWIKNEI